MERLRVLHDFYRTGRGVPSIDIDLRDCMRKGHSFKDAICPDSLEFREGPLHHGRQVSAGSMFLKEYASYIKDSMINELTSPGPHHDAVHRRDPRPHR